MRTAGDDVGTHVIDLAADQRVHRRRAAVERHLRRLRADDPVEHQAGGEEDRADAGVRLVELAGVGLHVGDELLEVLRREVLLGGDDDREAGDQPDRLKILGRPVGEVRIELDGGGVRPHLPHQDGVAVRVGAHRAGRTGGAAGAGHVLHHDLLAERARHVIGGDARRDVGRAARRERHDQRDRAVRIGLRERCARQHRQGGGAGGEMQESAALNGHDVSPVRLCRRLRGNATPVPG